MIHTLEMTDPDRIEAAIRTCSFYYSFAVPWS